MIEVIIEQDDKKIHEQIEDLKQLKELLLKYGYYTGLELHKKPDQRRTDENRHTR